MFLNPQLLAIVLYVFFDALCFAEETFADRCWSAKSVNINQWWWSLINDGDHIHRGQDRVTAKVGASKSLNAHSAVAHQHSPCEQWGFSAGGVAQHQCDWVCAASSVRGATRLLSQCHKVAKCSAGVVLVWVHTSHVALTTDLAITIPRKCGSQIRTQHLRYISKWSHHSKTQHFQCINRPYHEHLTTACTLTDNLQWGLLNCVYSVAPLWHRNQTTTSLRLRKWNYATFIKLQLVGSPLPP